MVNHLTNAMNVHDKGNEMEDWEIEIQKRDERYQLLEELEEYIQLESTEIGEACAALRNVANSMEYLSKEFQEAVDKELLEQLNMFKEQCTITERTETRTFTVRELEWD